MTRTFTVCVRVSLPTAALVWRPQKRRNPRIRRIRTLDSEYIRGLEKGHGVNLQISTFWIPCIGVKSHLSISLDEMSPATHSCDGAADCRSCRKNRGLGFSIAPADVLRNPRNAQHPRPSCSHRTALRRSLSFFSAAILACFSCSLDMDSCGSRPRADRTKQGVL